MTHIIELAEVSKTLGNKQVLNNISFAVPEQSIFGYLGNNGSGKSTTVRVMLGLLKYEQGSINIFNQSIGKNMPSLHRSIGCIIDSPALYEHLTAHEYLSIGVTLKQFNRSEIQRVLALVDLTDSKNQQIKHFSLGMKQRLAIANALLGQPKLLILDEPTNGLDPKGIIAMRELFKSLVNEFGTSIFISSHLLDEIEKVATDVAILNNGRIIVNDKLANLLNNAGELTISVNNHLEAQNIIQRFGHLATITANNSLVIGNVTKELCAQLNQLLIENNVALYQSRFNQNTLEQTYLSLNQ